MCRIRSAIPPFTAPDCTARTYARMLGYEDVAELLAETLVEEENADKKPTGIAESHVSRRVAWA